MGAFFVDGEWQDGELRGLTFLAGDRGMGKSTEAIRLAKSCSGSVGFFDTLGRHAHLLRGFPVFSQPGELKTYLLRNLKKRWRFVYVPRDEHPELHLKAVASLIRAVGRCIFEIDEIDVFCGAEYGEKRMPIELYNLAQFGRHYQVSMVATAREPYTLSPRFRSQCESMRLFRMQEENNLDFFKGRIGRVNVDRIRSLPPYKFLYWRAGDPNVEIRGGARRI